MRMFSFLEEISKKGVGCIVLVEDLNRWSRETVNHFMLKKTITSLGHSLQSVNMSLDDSEESELMETLSASVSQYERKKNAKRAKSCMLEQAKQGFWIMTPPPVTKLKESVVKYIVAETNRRQLTYKMH